MEQDLKRFFEGALSIDKTATQNLTATISKADSYWIWGGAAKIPIVGLALVNADTEFGINLRVLFEVEQNGKVTASYLFDEKITIQGKASSQEAVKDYPEHLRRVRYKEPESGKTLVFLSNNTALPPLTIAALYKSRWQVELFFKWTKQHLRVKKFLDTSENAVKTQIWCVVSTYVLIAIIKKELHLDASL